MSRDYLFDENERVVRVPQSYIVICGHEVGILESFFEKEVRRAMQRSSGSRCEAESIEAIGPNIIRYTNGVIAVEAELAPLAWQILSDVIEGHRHARATGMTELLQRYWNSARNAKELLDNVIDDDITIPLRRAGIPYTVGRKKPCVYLKKLKV